MSQVRLVAVGLTVLCVLVLPAAAVARGGPGGGGGQGGGGGHGGGGGSTPTGTDVSYPQCGSQLPSGPAFAIVGVNGGLANDLNPCFGPSASYQSELAWAAESTAGGTSQPNVQLYVNTADPGNAYNGTPILDWPLSDTITLSDGTSPTVTPPAGYGTCEPTPTDPTTGENSTACAWVYGYWRAAQDAVWLQTAAAAINAQSSPAVSDAVSGYQWWLDVETVNSWQTGTQGQAMNTADLEGMVAALTNAPLVGVYSTSSQWDTITGGTPSSSTLSGLAQWVPGAKTLSQAEQACTTATSFTGGPIAITQWRGNPDNDYAC